MTHDERIVKSLKTLPRETAGPYFTAGVLRRVNEAPRRALPWRRTWLAAAAVGLLTVSVFGARQWHEERERRQALAEVEVLLAEKDALEAELVSLRQQAAGARPVVYLSCTRDMDLVLDLARFERRGGFRDPLVTKRYPSVLKTGPAGAGQTLPPARVYRAVY